MKYPIYLFAALLLIACGGNPSEEADIPEVTESQESMTKGPDIVGKEMSYEADSVTMKGYLAYDADLSGPRPGVIVVHEWWGHNEHSRNVADKLAEEGYVAFALDMYGDGKTAAHPQDAMAFSGAVMSNFEGAKERFAAAMEVLQADEHCDKDEIAAVGYCFGGGIVLNMARQGVDLDAVATLHGSIGPIEPATPGSVKGRILVMNGADDPFVSAEAIDSFKSEMEAAGVDYEFVNYEGAIHAFTNPAATAKGEEFELPLAYNADADSLSWLKLGDFLEETFAGK
ncbi:MAG: dienelactone hydrolase family protein [Flavobacteriales bacterium]|nr:dienelactone hydrolase family protein [Flavobacteriales bacterium]